MRPVLAAGAATVLLMPAVAMACSCEYNWLSFVVPRHGSVGVPLNVEIRFSAKGVVTPTLVDATGTAVPVELVYGRAVSVVRLGELLRPKASYTLTLTARDGPSASTSFVTGTSEDRAPPILAGAPTISHHVSDGIGCPAEAFSLSWPTQDDDATPSAQLVMEAVLAARERVADTEADVASVGTLAVYSGGCGGNSNIMDMDVAFLKARAVDWAGNASAFSETLKLKPVDADADADAAPAGGGCGCGAVPPGLVLLAAAVLMMRRHRWNRVTSASGGAVPRAR